MLIIFKKGLSKVFFKTSIETALKALKATIDACIYKPGFNQSKVSFTDMGKDYWFLWLQSWHIFCEHLNSLENKKYLNNITNSSSVESYYHSTHVLQSIEYTLCVREWETGIREELNLMLSSPLFVYVIVIHFWSFRIWADSIKNYEWTHMEWKKACVDWMHAAMVTYWRNSSASVTVKL